MRLRARQRTLLALLAQNRGRLWRKTLYRRAMGGEPTAAERWAYFRALRRLIENGLVVKSRGWYIEVALTGKGRASLGHRTLLTK